MEGSHDDGNYLVRVRAQVMTRDDSTGGWVPMGAGGLSNVSVCRQSVSGDDDKVEYLIYGRRIADQSVVLSCTIKKDFQYNKVMPTFHHWSTGDKKFGLTFQTAADARAFDKGVRSAIEDLSEGNGDFPNFHDSDLGDDDVFMALELPIDSRSSSGSSTFSGSLCSQYRTSSGMPYPPADLGSSPYTHHLQRMQFARYQHPPPNHHPSNNNSYSLDPSLQRHHHHHRDPWTKEGRIDSGDKIELSGSGDLNSYVELSRDNSKNSRTAVDHEYSYPVIDGCYKPSPGGGGSLKKPYQPRPFDAFTCQPAAPRLPIKGKKKKGDKKGGGARSQCRHCLEMYSEMDNHRGSCEYAPDKVLTCISGASCISCAQCMLYHCMSDSEGDFNQHPCSCDTSDGHCPRRWTGLALLSFFVPCLWCYLPCRACHKCGVKCGVCGGRHDPA